MWIQLNQKLGEEKGLLQIGNQNVLNTATFFIVTFLEIMTGRSTALSQGT